MKLYIYLQFNLLLSFKDNMAIFQPFDFAH